MTTWYPINNWLFRQYQGPSTSVHPIHQCNVFMPNIKEGLLDPSIPVPPKGFPMVVLPIFGAWQISFILDKIDDSLPEYAPLANFLKAGYGIVSATLAVIRDPANGPGLTLTPHSDPNPFNRVLGSPDTLSYGVNYPKGSGLWVDIGVDTSAQLAIHPLQDPDWFNSVKSLVMLTQHIVHYGQADQMDVSQLYYYSSSAGMWTFMRATWGEELSTLMFQNPQVQEIHTVRNRYVGGFLRQSPTWWKIFNLGIGIPAGIPFMPVDPSHFPGDPTFVNWDIPDVTWQYLPPDYLDVCSPLDWVTKLTNIENNKKGRFVLSYDKQDDVGPPYDKSNDSAISTVVHSLWSGIALYKALNKAHPLIVEDASIATGEYTTIIENSDDRYAYVIAYWNDATGYTFPYVPKVKKDPTLYQFGDSKYTLDFRYGNPVFQSHKRYTTGQNKFFEGLDEYIPKLALNIEFPRRTVNFTESEVCEIELERDAWTSSLFDSGHLISPVSVVIKEILKGPSGTQKVLTIFTGDLVSRKILSPSRIELYFNTDKALLNSRPSWDLDTQCDNTFGDFWCGINIPSKSTTGTILLIQDSIITVNFTPQNPFSDETYYHRGYIEYQGLRISIRDWNSIAPSNFLLVQEPPPEWLNKIVTIAPGCDLSYDTCKVRWLNNLRFKGLAVASPSYESFATGGVKTPISIDL